jgi:tRNA A37 threonylcarbamoyladenosine dehydratase
MSGRDTKTGGGSETRADRLARALRDNLRRRKSQARARAEAEPEPVPSQDDTDSGTGSGSKGG